jgi:hypothetical protein
MDIVKQIDEWHEDQEDLPRLHLGASLAGHHCERYIWLNFRWAIREKISGRIRRLFRRGHNEEAIFIKDLKSIGFKIKIGEEINGQVQQIKANLGGHVAGSLDGVGYYKDEVYVLEFKTHNLKSFKELIESGVKKSKLTHYIQVQLYCHSQNINKCLYLAVCKDNDELYSEIITYDESVALQYLERAKVISITSHPPAKISESPSWYKCVMCPAYDFCHQNKSIEQKNCRTCMYSRPQDDGSWHCQRWEQTIPQDLKLQMKGCREHVMHPSLEP